MQPTIDVETVFKVKMGGSMSTDEVMKVLEFPFNQWITQENFPLSFTETPWEDEIEVIDPGRRFTKEEGIWILEDKDLLPPTREHGIKFAQQHGMATTSNSKPSLIFLHEEWQDPKGNARILCLDRGERHRRLSLIHADFGFNYYCVVAGVRRHK